MTDSLDDSLQTITDYLTHLGRPVVELFEDSLSRAEVTGKLEEVSLSTPSDVASLYRWHNGTREFPGAKLDDIQIVPGFHFPNLDETLNNYRTFKKNSRWSPDWLPLLANGGGDFYAVDCARNSATYGQVSNFMLGEAQHLVEYTSVSSMFGTFAEAYRRAIYFLDPQGYLEADDDAFFELAEMLNPDAPAWTQYRT